MSWLAAAAEGAAALGEGAAAAGAAEGAAAGAGAGAAIPAVSAEGSIAGGMGGAGSGMSGAKGGVAKAASVANAGLGGRTSPGLQMARAKMGADPVPNSGPPPEAPGWGSKLGGWADAYGAGTEGDMGDAMNSLAAGDYMGVAGYANKNKSDIPKIGGGQMPSMGGGNGGEGGEGGEGENARLRQQYLRRYYGR